MPQLLTKPLAFLKRDPKQPRKLPDKDADLSPEQRVELTGLGESLRKKQLQPVLAQPDGTIICGERRYRAAKLVGLETLEVKIADEPLSDQQVKVWQLVENMQRQDLTAFEKWTGAYELMLMNPGWRQKDLVEALGLSESMGVRILSPSRCSVAWQKALEDGKVGLSDCYAASQLPEKDQAELLKLKLSGASRDQVAAAGRRARNGTTPAVKMAKVKCCLPGGVKIVLSGQEMSLDDTIEALAEGLKAAKKAQADGLDAKTWTAVMRDKAKVS